MVQWFKLQTSKSEAAFVSVLIKQTLAFCSTALDTTRAWDPIVFCEIVIGQLLKFLPVIFNWLTLTSVVAR